MDFLKQIFSSGELTPHGFCLLWQPALLWLNVVSDAVIGLSYFSIPIALTVLVVRRRDISFSWIFWLFAAFIMACGTTHFLSIWTLWHADYGVEALVKAITAVVSLLTALLLWPLMPKLLSLPSSSALQDLNQSLAREIDERERLIGVVRETGDRFRALYYRTPAPLSSQDDRGCITDANEYLFQLTGFTRDEMLGHPGISFMTARSADYVQQTLWPGLLKQGSLRDAEIEIVRKDGVILQTLLSSVVECDDNGRAMTVYSVLTDVTARREAETALSREIEERQHMKEMLHQSQKMEAVGQLTGGIAHDFNNLLTAINGNLDLLRIRTEGNAKVANLLESAAKAVQRGASLTKQLLSFSRRQMLRPEVFSLENRFEAMRTLLAGSLRSDIEFDVKFSLDLWPVRVDPGEFDLAVINICVNARDAMPRGGILHIGARNVVLPGDAPGVELSGEYVAVFIRDNGTGIDADTLTKVFEPFFTTKEVGKGTGLGLSQVYGFARQSGGSANIESEVGAGTTVTLYLPRAHAMPEAPRQPVETCIPVATGAVLMVDDDDDVAFASEALLEDIGFRVWRARNPAEALSMLQSGQTRFDIVFSDIVMPGGMDGLDLAREIRNRYPGLPVVLTTGHSQAAASAGGDYTILLKPYTRAQLTRALTAR